MAQIGLFILMDHKKTLHLLVIIQESLLVFNYDQKQHLQSYVKYQQVCSLKLLENSQHLAFHCHEINDFAAFKLQGHFIYDLLQNSYYWHSCIQTSFQEFLIHLLPSDFDKNYARNLSRFFDRVIQNFIIHMPIVGLDHFSYLSPNQDS